MNDIGKELYGRVRADFERRLAAEKHPPKDMRGVSDYSARVGRYLAEAIAANVTEDALPDRRLYYNIAESILEPSLRTNYELVNDTAAEVQRLLDERQGLHIKPARAEYPTERVHTVIGAASEEGIEFDRALRRMTSPAENITQSFADDFMQANAAQRSRAGFDTFIERQGGLNCCPWCAGLVGVFAYPKGLPKEVFARHDNCTCSVTYGTKGGARQNAWTKAKWNVPPIEEPHRMTADEAAEKGAFDKPRRLTGGANGGILNYRDSSNEFMPVSPEAYDRVKPFDIFGDERDHKVAAAMRYVLDQVKGKEPGTEWLGLYKHLNINLVDGEFSATADGEVPPISYEKPYITIHNHASGDTFSIGDIYNLSADRNCRAIYVVGNNGNCYALSKTDNCDETGFYEKVMMRRLGFEPYTEPTEHEFIKECERYGVKYLERVH